MDINILNTSTHQRIGKSVLHNKNDTCNFKPGKQLYDGLRWK